MGGADCWYWDVAWVMGIAGWWVWGRANTLYMGGMDGGLDKWRSPGGRRGISRGRWGGHGFF